jgi:hypothetical protein
MIDSYYKMRGLILRAAQTRRPWTTSAWPNIAGGRILRIWLLLPRRAQGTVTLTIDGREVTAPEGATIWQAAKAAGVDIPVLCHDERFDPVVVCRMCVVDVGAPAFAASCVRAC